MTALEPAGMVARAAGFDTDQDYDRWGHYDSLRRSNLTLRNRFDRESQMFDGVSESGEPEAAVGSFAGSQERASLARRFRRGLCVEFRFSFRIHDLAPSRSGEGSVGGSSASEPPSAPTTGAHR